MSAQQWQDLQEAILFMFLPAFEYGLASLLAGGMIAALWILFLDLFRRMTRR